MSDIILAEKAGFCFGVDRAIKLIEDMVAEGKKVATLGPIIHNQQVIDDLSSRGVIVVSSPDEVPEDTVLVLRTHGVTRDVLESVEESGCQYIDAACPFVKKIHEIVNNNYKQGKRIIILGEEGHDEVVGINGWCNNTAIIFDDIENLLREDFDYWHQDDCIRESSAVMLTLSEIKKLRKKYEEGEV